MKVLWATRFVKSGGSAAVIIPKEVRDFLGLKPGDVMVMRLFGKVLIVRRLDPSQVIDTSQIPSDVLPSAVRS